MQKSDPVLSLSPSFKAYSSANFSSEDEISRPYPHDTVDDGEDDDGDFEFPFPCRPADHIFPVFNRQLLSPDTQENVVDGAASHLQLLIKDRDPPSSSSSSEEDELETIPDGTYCVWTGPSGSSARCEKSSSTGSSRRFRFRDLLHRSHSDGKETFVFLRAEKSGEKAEKRRSSFDGKGKEKENVKRGEKERREMRYVKNCAVDRRRTFLPYKQRLVDFSFGFGFFSFTNPPSKF